jgi:hypothetical protein
MLTCALMAGALLIPTPAEARTACAPRQAIVERLTGMFNEHRASLMIDNQGNLVEIFANLGTGSWTLLITRPGGSACVVSSGQDYTNTIETAPDTGTDS